MHLLFFCIFETDMFFKCQSLSKLADIFLSNEEFLFKQIDTFMKKSPLTVRFMYEQGAFKNKL